MSAYRRPDAELATCAVCAATMQREAARIEKSGFVLCAKCYARRATGEDDRTIRRWNGENTPAMWIAVAFLPVAVLVYGFFLRFCGP